MELSLVDDTFEIILGVHSIAHALNNEKRDYKKLFGTKEAISDIRKNSKVDEFEEKNLHDFQQIAKKYIEKLGFKYSRIPGNAFLLAKKQPEYSHSDFYNDVENKEKYKVVVLDQISDVHNGAAILRSCAFFGVDTLIVTGKNSFGLSPGFTRIASGGYEHVNILQVNSIAKFIPKLKEKGFWLIGFSEHAKETSVENPPEKAALIMGNEEKGISHAVMRLLDYQVRLEANGGIKSLNVSAASILAMERFLN